MTIEVFENIETPAVLLDRKELLKNISRMQRKADRHHIKLRPHVKTHKSLKIADLQLAEGACGITTSKADEAIVFLRAGIKSITVAHPLFVPSKFDRLFSSAHENSTDLRLIVDSEEALDIIAHKAMAHRIKPGVFIKIDVGLNRCGLREGDEKILKLAEAIKACESLDFCGILSHAGHSYGVSNRDEASQIAEDERLMMLRIKEKIEQTGVPVSEISVGSTPTVLATGYFDGITEIRPGNYVFLDQTPVRIGVADHSQVALTVIATVISKNSDYYIIDAGSKTLTSDQGAHGVSTRTGYGVGYTLETFEKKLIPLNIEKLSEEHGFIPRNGWNLPLGTKIRIIPNHSCPVANLAREYIVFDGSDCESWPVDASGLVR